MHKSVIHRHNISHILALMVHYLASFNHKLKAELIQRPFCCFTFYILPTKKIAFPRSISMRKFRTMMLSAYGASVAACVSSPSLVLLSVRN